MKIRDWLKSKIIHGSERGVTLVEAAVTVLLLGGGVLTMVLTMSGGVMAVQVNDEEVTAQGLARTQMEYTKEYLYNTGATTYPKVAAPDSYNITVSVAAVPLATNNIQKITVNVSREGNSILSIQDYKVNR
jgi:hypothetical protein